MASSSALSLQTISFKYHVFLSFKGEDTSKTFVDHLYHALQQRGIVIYRDDERIEKGDWIDGQILRSIEDSRFHIIVFSKDYASSRRCLEELVAIMECWETKDQTAIPIFYDVQPTEVRNQTGAVGLAFAQLKKHRSDEEATQRWGRALRNAAELAGFELKTTADGHEANFIKRFVEHVSHELFFNFSIPKNLVGMKSRVENVISLLELDCDDVRMVGIKGMGGVGKTTLAKSVFDHIGNRFEYKRFVEDIREQSSSGILQLQNDILKDVLNDQSFVVRSFYEGKMMMRKMMRNRKVLLVLDDVNHVDQLKALVGELDWFKGGSRIIITTRDAHVLIAHGIKIQNIIDVNLLTEEEAICLFSRCTFGQEVPHQEYKELSRTILRYASGLPLAINVLGSFLFGKSLSEWEYAIERLKVIPMRETLKRLELSYDALVSTEKEIFLDIACILNGEKLDKAIKILESCGYNAAIGLRDLEMKSLVTISDGGRLHLHGRIEEMGMDIVRRLHPEPRKHSRLWIKEEIENILLNDLGTKATRSIKLVNTHLNVDIIMNSLRNMKKLRFMYVDKSYKSVEYTSPSSYNIASLPHSLRFLSWRNYPLRCLPNSIQADMLIGLEIVGSNITQFWEGGDRKVLNKLRFLDLSFSKLTTFDLGMTPHLEELHLRGCIHFVELHMHGEFRKLKYLNLSGSLVNKFNLGLVPCLEELHLEECYEFVELQVPVESPNLKVLRLGGSKVSNLNLGLTPLLKSLYLDNCHHLREIQASVGCLKKLVYLNSSGSMRSENLHVEKRFESSGVASLATLKVISESVVDICPLHPSNMLPKLQFECFYEEPLPLSSGNLEKLLCLGLCGCNDLKSFSATICGLQRLEKLTLEGSIPAVPEDLYQLESLVELSLSMKDLKRLPDSICMLKHLKSLQLESCLLLEQLPSSLGMLEGLEELLISYCTSLRGIPNSICTMKHLKRLHIPYCDLVKELPEEFGSLKGLEELNIEGTRISRLPDSIFEVEGLCIIGSRERLQSYGFTSLTKISKYTASCEVKKKQ